MAEAKFFRCTKCGNLVYVAHDGGGPLVCCGEPMEALKAGSTDAATEKHVPVISEAPHGHITVKVGEVEHPMTEEHYIEWVCVVTDGRASFKFFKPGDKPEATFGGVAGASVTAYAYCNLHGLWKAEA
ncbi:MULTISPECIES: desulfoferrodoxin [Olsenella]|uniref:desulfoferrodoxin n=1 Tax=Olsenella TaxID=133925 RepID=UPI00071D26AA|nr:MULTISPECIES: desulfoferrodoxin [Olsenella]OFK22300.1 desulfoferrodoxin [Olsenella sp. HMSC062G07]